MGEYSQSSLLNAQFWRVLSSFLACCAPQVFYLNRTVDPGSFFSKVYDLTYFYMMIKLDTNRPWWPSRLSCHVSNSSRDRGLGHRVESLLWIPQSQKWLVTIQIVGRRVAVVPLRISNWVSAIRHTQCDWVLQ